MGLIDKDVKPHPVVADEVKGWDQLNEQEQKLSCKAMEAYAGMSPSGHDTNNGGLSKSEGMVECIDHNVGRVGDYLDSIGELDNTYIMFMSDNGAEGAAYEVWL